MSEQSPERNIYLEQVKAQQQQIEVDLKSNRASNFRVERSRRLAGEGGPVSGGTAGIDVRITGFWRWKSVVVPPNVYVIHTRRGHKEPLTIGLGVSFKYDPYTDAFLVVPAAMQTILLSAYCVCKELQGFVVQGYVQWIIDDFATAYKKLDFTDTLDPMKVVNIQLREQAEAAIKDKVATMSIDEILSDKQPIIEELTARLRRVAEGEGQDSGLGLRIVTVQIKEAIVCSSRLWENLQKPFRSERARVARLAELAAQQEIDQREREHEKQKTTAQIEDENVISILRTQKQTETFEREQQELIKRTQQEQEASRKNAVEVSESKKVEDKLKQEQDEANIKNEQLLAAARAEARHKELLQKLELEIAESARQAEAAKAAFELERVRLEKEAEELRLKLEFELKRKELEVKAGLSLEEAKLQLKKHETEAELVFAEQRQKIANDLSANHLQAKMLEGLPAIAGKLPQPKELKVISMGNGSHGAEALSGVIAQVLSVVEALKPERKENK
jgi:flotillin